MVHARSRLLHEQQRSYSRHLRGGWRTSSSLTRSVPDTTATEDTVVAVATPVERAKSGVCGTAISDFDGGVKTHWSYVIEPSTDYLGNARGASPVEKSRAFPGTLRQRGCSGCLQEATFLGVLSGSLWRPKRSHLRNNISPCRLGSSGGGRA